MTRNRAQIENDQTVLVTGGAGYIGSHVLLSLLEAGYRPVVLDNLSTGNRRMIPRDVIFFEGDVKDRKLVTDILKEHCCSAVMHFAGSIVVEESVALPLKYYDNNVAATISLLEACQMTGIQAFIFSSTAAVYKGGLDRSLRETDPLDPQNPYGRSKLAVEHILTDCRAGYGDEWGLRSVTLRYFNVAGADPKLRTGLSTENATHLIKRACQAATDQLPEIGVFGTDYDTKDGTCIRDYIHVSDLTDVHVLAVDHLLREKGNGGTFNCGYGRGYSVLEVLDAVDRHRPTPIKRKIVSRRPGDSASLVADASLVRKTFDWRPRHDDIDQIVATALAWEKSLLFPTRSEQN